MSSPGIVIIGILAVAVLYVLVPRVLHILAFYRAPRAVSCPETGEPVRVDLDASRAAVTSAFGWPRLRVSWCTLWPQRRGCGQACVESPEVDRPA
jgi:hypothetical protein